MAMARRVVPTLLTVCVLGLSACTSSGGKSPSSSSVPPGSTPASTSTSTSYAAPKPPAGNPLTGGRVSKNPVVAVKIEDTALGRPQVGINEADIVYIEQVEGGLTRLVAIFNSKLPVVEPVRSTRANDPQLVSEYGPIIYVASGGDHAELQPLDASSLRSDINDRGGPGFRRDPNRPIPNNLQANLALIAKRFPKAPRAKDIGLTWSNAFSHAGTKPGTVVQTRVGGTPVTFKWWAKLHRYVRYIDGAVQRTANGQLIDTPNVIVQFCRSTVYWRDIDDAGNPAQWTHTVGSGRVVVFRDGRRIVGTWTRKRQKDGTVLHGPGGKQIALTPGGAWFVLTANGTPLQ